VIYRKFRETDTDVEYHYGKSEGDLNERVVIDKRDPTGPPKECSSQLGRKVIGRVNSERTDDEWPGGGAIQS
jgi:hypothetical protein